MILVTFLPLFLNIIFANNRTGVTKWRTELLVTLLSKGKTLWRKIPCWCWRAPWAGMLRRSAVLQQGSKTQSQEVATFPVRCQCKAMLQWNGSRACVTRGSSPDTKQFRIIDIKNKIQHTLKGRAMCARHWPCCWAHVCRALCLNLRWLRIQFPSQVRLIWCWT